MAAARLTIRKTSSASAIESPPPRLREMRAQVITGS
jgi:hypothetical protein